MTTKGIIFDMDGVLVDAMPFHAEAMSRAIKEITNHEIDKKNIFLLEGMPSSDLVKEIFKRENINKKRDVDDDDDLAKQIGSRKEQVFKQIQNAKGIDGAKELLEDLTSNFGQSCTKAVVSGAAREEVEAILDKNIGIKYFDFIITGDDIEKGKPNPAPFLIALNKMNLPASQVIVVENSPLGVEAANKAGLECIITLNNTPLDIHNDFKKVMSSDPKKFTFRDTKSTSRILKKWCCVKQ
jgi:beta-phosphoglucomutase-like phosphatase (HAD superfamily)